MLKLICGPSGIGKTATITEWIRRDIQNEKRCYLLVPEQQAYISEAELLKALPQNAGRFFEVVHFSGLADAVFHLYGGVTHTSLSQGMKKIVMWDTLRSLSHLLTRYGTATTKDLTLTSLMLQTVEELHTNGISADLLETTASKLSKESSLYKKMIDLSWIDAEYRRRLEESFGQDPSDRLTRLAKTLQLHPHFQNCNVFIDSFTSFTAQEYCVLKEILKQADLVTVSLMSNAYTLPLPHFESTTETAKRLEKLAKAVNQPIEKTLLQAPLSAPKALALRIVEHDLWRFDVKREDRIPVPNDDNSVLMMRCANIYEESEAAALNILSLIHEGMHYGDIVIVVRDIESYRGVLDAALERYQIPFFLSERTDLSSLPLSRLILSALRAVSRGYKMQDIITMVKTGLTGVDVKDGAMFEEYCETWHMNGKRFTDDVWSMNPDGLTTQRSARAEEILAAANRSRQILIEPLQKLEAKLRASTKMVDRCRALFEYLNDLQISDQLSARANAELITGHPRLAGETIRIYQFFTKTLSELCRAFPDTELNVDEFISVLSILFSESDIGSVPSLHDCVVIGSASTIRVEHNLASIVLGLCEGEFPRAATDDGLFTEEDKVEMEAYGLMLDSRARIRSSEELLYIYKAFSKPTERLILSTVSHKTDGSELTPSLAFSRVSYLLAKEPIVFQYDAIKAHLPSLQNANTIENIYLAPLRDQAVLRLSQSKLQAFMLCPYRYYCTYQLKLREKKDSRPSYADDGLFLHYIFEHFLIDIQNDIKKGLYPDKQSIENAAKGILNNYVQEVCPIPPELMDSRLLHLFERLRKMAVMMLENIIAELKSSKFVPTKFEQAIGLNSEDGLPPVIINLKNGGKVILSGMVDRIDILEQEEKIYVRIVDYKSGTHVFSPEDVRQGLDIQLVLYLLAVVSSNDCTIIPAGAQYLFAKTTKGKLEVHRSGFILEEEAVIAAADQTPDQSFTKKLCHFNHDEMNDLFLNMKKAVELAADRMIQGEAFKTPSEKACSFCPIRANCDQAWHS